MSFWQIDLAVVQLTKRIKTMLAPMACELRDVMPEGRYVHE